MVQYFGRRIFMKCQQASAIVRDGRTDERNQTLGNGLAIVCADQVGDFRVPGGTVKYRMQTPLPSLE